MNVVSCMKLECSFSSYLFSHWRSWCKNSFISILDAVSSSSFKQEIAGIEVSFSDEKMKLKIQGREIEFKLDK